jgi:hypothetical protein
MSQDHSNWMPQPPSARTGGDPRCPATACRCIIGVLTVLAGVLTSLAFAPAALAGRAGAPGVAGTPMTAMVIGDSLTQGSAGDFTWRYRLYNALTAAGVTITYEGPYTDLFDNVANTWDSNHTYADPNFDQHHDARWGETLQTAAGLIQNDVITYSPDYLRVLLGLNDMAWGFSDAADTESHLKAFIAAARAAKPDERFIFGEIPPDTREQSDPAFAAMIADYNNRLVSDAAALSTPQSSIFVTGGGADIVPATDTWDGTHPNAQGDQKIAASFANALAGLSWLASC